MVKAKKERAKGEDRVSPSVPLRTALLRRTRDIVGRLPAMGGLPSLTYSPLFPVVIAGVYAEVSKNIGIERRLLTMLGIVACCSSARGFCTFYDLELLTGNDSPTVKAYMECMRSSNLIMRLPTKQRLGVNHVFGHVPTPYGLEVMDMVRELWYIMVADLKKKKLPTDRLLTKKP